MTLLMSAARGDASLAAAAKALGNGDLEGAQTNLENAQLEYLRAGVQDRNELVEQIRARVESAVGQRKPKSPLSPSGELGERLRLSKQEGDTVMAEATRMLSQKDYESARILADKARALFDKAGPEVARERAAVVGNLISYIQIEQERDLLMARRKRQKEREEEEARRLEQRLADAAEAALSVQFGSPVPSKTSLNQADASEGGVGGARRKADVCILVDNGSSRAASTLALRSLCARLQQRTGISAVIPASMAHSDKVPVDELGGQRALLLGEALRGACRADAEVSFVVVPLFFGPSLSVTKKIPEALKDFAVERAYAAVDQFKEAKALRYAVAGPLGEDPGLVRVLAEEVERLVAEEALEKPAVVVVDHGSPSPKVTALRDLVTDGIAIALAEGVAGSVSAASMERRPGDEYLFCEPLLAKCLPRVGDGVSDVVLAMMFLLPGTHAGPGADIAQAPGPNPKTQPPTPRHPNRKPET